MRTGSEKLTIQSLTKQMSTIAFNILVAVLSILFFTLIYLSKGVRNTKRFRYLPLGTAGVAAAVIAAAFLADADTKFRISMLCILAVPVISVHIKSILLSREDEGLRRVCMPVRINSVLIYAAYIPITVLYLQ